MWFVFAEKKDLLESVGRFEMDVNTSLRAIYLRPFGWLYGVAALKGRG